MRKTWIGVFGLLILAGIAAVFNVALAAYNGNVSGYAWSPQAGWVSFENTGLYGVEVSDTLIDGYAWGEKIGFISFTRDTGTPDYGVTVTLYETGGRLSGYAWNPQAGYIRMAATGSNYSNDSAINYGVTVNGTTGVCSGYAWSEKMGWIKFGGTCVTGTSGICASNSAYGVTTTWRGASESIATTGHL